MYDRTPTVAGVVATVADLNNGAGTIADGHYWYSARVIDAAGNVGGVTPPAAGATVNPATGLHVKIETHPPVYVAPDLTDDSDSGRPRSPDTIQREKDNLTNVVLPDFQGTLTDPDTGLPEVGASVELFVNGTTAGMGLTDANGYYKITSTVLLVEGANSITVQATDTVGNLGPVSAALTVTLDVSPPTLIIPDLDTASDTGRSNTDNVTGDNTPTFVGTDAEPFALVRYYAEELDANDMPNGVKFAIGEALADANGHYTLTAGTFVRPYPTDTGASFGDPPPPDQIIQMIADGRYAITAVQYDVAGNQSREVGFGQPGTVIIDGTDANDHGSRDTTNNVNIDGWNYIQKALDNIGPNVINGNVSIAALGMDPSQNTFGAPGAIYWTFTDSVLPGLGWNLVYVAKADIDTFLSGGAVTGHTYGTGTTVTDVPGYSLDDAGLLYITTVNNASGDLSTNDLAVINQHGDDIADFVNTGGGLFSHAENASFFGGGGGGVPSYGWLQSIFPGLIVVDAAGFANSIQITPEGQTAFPGLTPADLSTGPWHNYFTGDLGGLTVLATDLYSSGTSQTRVPLILTGASVTVANLLLVVDTTHPVPTLTPDLQPTSDTPAPGAPATSPA